MGRINSYSNSETVAYSRISVGTTAVPVGTIPSGVYSCTVRVIANASSTGVPAINATIIGTPTTTNGMPLWNGDVMDIYPGELESAKFISADGLTHTLCIEFTRLS